MLPTMVIEPLSRHLDSVKRQHQTDLARGFGRVVLPFALDRKYPSTHRMGLAVRVSRVSGMYGPEMGATNALSPSRISRPEGGGARGTPGRDDQARGTAHVPALIRYTPARGWVRHSDRAGAAGPRGRQHDDDVHARAQSGPAWRAQPCRLPLIDRAIPVGREHWRPTTARCCSMERAKSLIFWQVDRCDVAS